MGVEDEVGCCAMAANADAAKTSVIVSAVFFIEFVFC